MTITELRVLIQDTIYTRWQAAHSTIPIYFETAVKTPTRKPYVIFRLQFGDEKRADIGADKSRFRMVGAIIANLYSLPKTKNSDHDAYIETIRLLNHDQPFSGVLMRGINMTGRKPTNDRDITSVILTFQVDSFET